MAHLYHQGDTRLFLTGTPFAQVGGPGWWVGWTARSGWPALWLAAVAETGDLEEPEEISIPDGAVLSDRGQPALCSGRVYWPGRDRGVWALDCRTRALERIIEADEGEPQVWVEKDGPRIARESQQALKVSLTAPREGQVVAYHPAGMPPLRGVFSTTGQLAVVGAGITSFDMLSGDQLHHLPAFRGSWVDGALVESRDGEPRLLVLTRDQQDGELSAWRLSTGQRESLWRGPGLEPRELLPVAGTLFITYRGGVIRLTEGS